jgi:regulation of enolase protein 1 (concanavalin A-like superfamily)
MIPATVSIPALPAALTWDGAPATSTITADDALTITAPGATDLFRDPQGQSIQHNAPRLLFLPHTQFTLSARVTVDFQTTYDAGVLLLYVHDTVWAKLCFELSPQHQPMIVSVVTNDRSDDCNSVVLDRHDAYLRITSLGNAFAFHYSLDSAMWRLVRYFALPDTAGARAGFAAQSPTGTTCRVTFDTIRYAPSSVSDIRSGV